MPVINRRNEVENGGAGGGNSHLGGRVARGGGCMKFGTIEDA